MYQLIGSDDSKGVTRISDNATIPASPTNTDWQRYLNWRDGYTDENGEVHAPNTPAPDPADTFAAYKETKRQWLRNECERIILAKWPVWLQLNAISNPSTHPTYVSERDSVRAESNRVDPLVVAVAEVDGKVGIDAAIAQVAWPNIGVLTHA